MGLWSVIYNTRPWAQGVGVFSNHDLRCLFLVVVDSNLSAIGPADPDLAGQSVATTPQKGRVDSVAV